MNLPSDFSQRTHELLGDNDYRQLEDALQDEAPVSIRVNSAKCDKEVKGERVPWSANGIYLAERPTFTFDPLFHAGLCMDHHRHIPDCACPSSQYILLHILSSAHRSA